MTRDPLPGQQNHEQEKNDLNVEEVTFYSSREPLAGTLKLPDDASVDNPVPVVVQGPGWFGVRDSTHYLPYHEALLEAGIAVLVFDYHGFGDSKGSSVYFDPADQVLDWQAANDYVVSRPELDGERLGAFGLGATGGGNAVMVAAMDRRVKAVVSNVPVADGRDWLHRMRREYEWLDLLQRVESDRIQRALTGQGALVDPNEDIMIQTPERKTNPVKKNIEGRSPAQVELASVEAILRYRPVDVVGSIAPRALMIVAVENDPTTPEDHARQLYENAGQPKSLVVQKKTTHYGAYSDYKELITPVTVDWFRAHLVDSDIDVLTSEGEEPRRLFKDRTTAP
jgi:fermentation-respiration switch protein FrsA (DUF1100 family)